MVISLSSCCPAPMSLAVWAIIVTLPPDGFRIIVGEES